MDFNYPAEKLCAARHSLMLPHSSGIDHSVSQAFHNCHLAFYEIDTAQLSDDVRTRISRIKELMDTQNLADISGRGTWAVKASSFSDDQLIILSSDVDQLASWFTRKSWGIE